ncbi:MAG: glycosyltransferase family 4 protein [Synechococcus sp.]
MHIAWLGKKSPFCGNVTYGLEVTNALIQRGHKVSFIHFADGNTEHSNNGELIQDGSWEEEVSLPFLYKSQILTIHTPKSSKVLANALQDIQPDLVHASLTLSPLDLSLPELYKDLGIPAVSTFHPAFDRRRRNIASRTQHFLYKLYAPSLANYDSTVIFSQIQKRILEEMGVPGDRIAIIPNGVDVAKYSPGPSNIKEELGAERLFVYQGRISPEKNVEALLKAWKQAQMGPQAKLAIIGDGPMAATLKSFYHAEHGIEWLGYISDEARRVEILRGADVFILPSLIEGLSLSMLEAMACGVAIVATDVGADGEAIGDGAGIILSPFKTANELATLLPILRDQREFTQLLGVKARQRVLQRYTLSRNISQLEELYARVTGQLKEQDLPIQEHPLSAQRSR